MQAITLTEAREDAGLSQRDLAAATGVPRGTLWNWETGRCFPSDTTTVGKVAAVLGVPASRLAI